MKTIKVIDLLNKIANGEEVPKKIKYENRILYLDDEGNEYEPTFNYYDKDGENALFEGWIGQYLNDEVEIIEEHNEEPQEHKIPEKIEICYSPDIEEEIFYEKGNKPNHYVLGDAGNKLIISKINEILDYLEVNNGIMD